MRGMEGHLFFWVFLLIIFFFAICLVISFDKDNGHDSVEDELFLTKLLAFTFFCLKVCLVLCAAMLILIIIECVFYYCQSRGRKSK